ncbi:MAG: DUF697 domain-containing protein [Deltaproteobacteria bacterium]|nr:DUF697 domain-containing protein [Deltaproteobacteria bacterium]
MAKYLETLRRVMDGDYEHASKEEKDAAVHDVIQVCSIAAAAVTIQPFPLLDTALIAPIQIGLVQAIGRIHGYRLDKKSILEILGTFGASLVAQNVIMAAAKLIPFAGWIITTSMAYALTWAIGEVSDHYFRNGRGVPEGELREMFKRVYEQKKAEKQAQNKGNDTLKERLEQLKKAYEAGLLTEDEFTRKKEEMLRSF